MKHKHRIILFILAIILLNGFIFLVPAEEKGSEIPEEPVLRLTKVPVYGSTANVEGKAIYLSGRTLNPDDYRVTLFLQTSLNGSYWVKPTYKQPSMGLDRSGAFSLDYTTGGIDEKAVVLHILLIPSGYTPSDFQQTHSIALDYVRVDRESNGLYTVEPSTALDPVKESRPGDANDDGEIDILDLVSIIDYIVSGTPCPCITNADANGDGEVDILDLVWIIDQIVGS